MARTTVLSSSNSGSATNFSAGTKDVFCAYPAGKSVNLDASGDVTISTGFLRATETDASNGIMANATTISANYTVPTNYNALSAGPVTVNSGVSVTVNSGSVWTVV